MKFKEDWPEAKERLEALWKGRCLDRVCLDVAAPSGKKMKGPPPPEDPERKWMDPDWVIPNALATLQNTWWGGEAIPSYLLMGGWVVSLGGQPDFDLKTIWFETRDVDFSKPSPFRHDPADPWVEKHTKLYMALAEAAGADDFLVGSPCILPANDLLSMHMGTDRFLMALMDHPEWMKQAIVDGARDLVTARRELAQSIREKHEFWYGNGGWMPFWAPESYTSTQSDVSCMLSPDMFEEFVLPELDVYGKAFGNMWYHLDGGTARQHLPCLLSRPYLKVVQYTPMPSEPPNGPAHLDMYKKIQAAGKIIHINLPGENVEPLVRALDPGLLMLKVSCKNMEEGKTLLDSAKRWHRAKSAK